MRVLVQRCKKASCQVDNKTISKINEGLVLFVGFTDTDTSDTIIKMVNKIINLRIFPDSEGVMNLSILDLNLSILSISQFTLYADTKKGNRPSYLKALKSDKAKELYDLFNQELKKHLKTETGVFGADMEIELINMGPTTILLER